MRGGHLVGVFVVRSVAYPPARWYRKGQLLQAAGRWYPAGRCCRRIYSRISSDIHKRIRARRTSLKIKFCARKVLTSMHSVRLEPTKLILVGTRTTCQATGDAYSYGYCYLCSKLRVDKAMSWHVYTTGRYEIHIL